MIWIHKIPKEEQYYYYTEIQKYHITSMHLKIKTEQYCVSNYLSSTKRNLSDDSGLDLIIPKDTVVPKSAIGYKINLDLTLEPSFEASMMGKFVGITYTHVRVFRRPLYDSQIQLV